MGKRNGLSEYTYSEIIWKLDPPCKNTIHEPTEIDAAIVALREMFLDRVSKNQRMRLPIYKRDKGDIDCMADVLGNGKSIVENWALPFGHRKVPNAHIDWLREQIKIQGLSLVVSIEK